MIVLASGSEGRRELLQREGLPFIAVPSGVEEPPPSAADAARPGDYTLRLARDKAMAVCARLQAIPSLAESLRPLVLGCDTCIHVDRTILGKPRDAGQAADFLQRLSGREHRVVSGLCVVDAGNGSVQQTSVESGVRLRRLGSGVLRDYLRSGEWAGAAGGYRVQGKGARLVERVRGSHSNVVGLPLEALYGILQQTDTLE